MARNDDSPWLVPGINERLIELHSANVMSMREIGDRLAFEFEVELTRNAIIGRSRRLGLPQRPMSSVQRKETIEKKRPPPVRIEAPIEPADSVPIEGDQSLTIYQLRDGVCKWVLDDFGSRPPYSYCGHAAEIGCSWCPEHYNKVYCRPRVTWA